MTKVRIEHIRSAKLCMSGARAWAKRNNIDWATFLKDGIEISELEKIDDHLAKLVIAEARKEV